MDSRASPNNPDSEYWVRMAEYNPVVGIRLFGGSYAEAVRRGNGVPPLTRKKEGDKVKEFSRRSRMALARTVFATDITFRSMMTLTSGAEFSNDGKKCKADLNRFLVWLRYHYPTDYLWFWEFQERGAPHCHILLEIDHPGSEGHRKFARAWVKAQQLDPAYIAWDKKRNIPYSYAERVYRFHCRSKQWETVREQEGAKRYALMYAFKPHQKEVPPDYQNVGVFWRASRGVTKSVRIRAEYELGNDELRAVLAMSGHSAAKMPFLPKHLFNVGKAEELLGLTQERVRTA